MHCIFKPGSVFHDYWQTLNTIHLILYTGRVKQLIENKFLKPDAIRLFILDEADKLLDDNFQSQTK